MINDPICSNNRMHSVMTDNITVLYKKGYLTDIDVFFANFIADLSNNDDQDVRLAAALVSSATGRGDVYLDLGSLAEKPMFHESDQEEPARHPKLLTWSQKIRQSPAVGRPGDFRPLILDQKNRLYLYRYWDYEKKLSDAIINRAKVVIENVDLDVLKDSLKRLFPQNKDHGFTWQKVAALIATFKRFCVITGGPGTGKTFTVAKILALLVEQAEDAKFRILIAAPTGKAAARIGESIRAAKETLNCSRITRSAIPSEAFTIHRMLKTIPGSPYFYHNAENPLEADVVVVDEVSMVDLALMSKLIEALPLDARLILIGDKDQLASVEAGSVLGDICNGDNVHKFSCDFCKKFEEVTQEQFDDSAKACKEEKGLYDCMVELKKSYRFSGSSSIRELSRAVNLGDIETAFSLLNKNNDQISWEKIEKPRDLTRAISKLIIDGYSGYLKESDPARALERFNHFKILCAVKIGPFGVQAVNRLAERVLSQRGLIEPDGSDSNPWYKGRPVLITCNDYSLGLFNGDIGITLSSPDSDRKGLSVFFPGDSGKPKRLALDRLPEHETVYAMTVHKSQGSEFGNVLFVLPDKDYPVLTRELFYTGVTRASQNVSIWGTQDIIRATILRKIERTSALKDALWGEKQNAINKLDGPEAQNLPGAGGQHIGQS